jgi:hypothetical protein
LGSNALEVKDAVDKALGQASEVEKRLEHFETVHRTAIWWVRAEVRAGALYDCLWTSLERAHPAFFTPAQQAALAKLQGLQQRLSLVNPTSASTVAQTIAQTQGMVIATWTSTRDQYLEVLATRMVRHYATADVLSRRYAFDGVEIARARRRLPAIASELGDDKMSSLLAELPDPTDPAPDPKDRRRLRYKGEVWRAFPAP